MKRTRLLTFLLILVSLSLVQPVPASASGNAAHLTVYDAGIAEFLEERTIDLQPGINNVEWRSLVPRAFLRTLRVTAEDAEVIRQDVTFDGNEVRNEKTAVVHLVIRNSGSAGPRQVRIDYLAPGITWQNDYSMVLDATQEGAPPRGATLDSWVSVFNQTGTDMFAANLDLVAGEIALLLGDGSRLRADSVNLAQRGAEDLVAIAPASSEVSGLSVFSRFRLGRNISMTANKTMNRLPIFQRARLQVIQRLVFENEHSTQTLGRGGFMLLPRGLEVRLVSKNPTEGSMPAGQVTIYSQSRDAGIAQVVGQDRVPLTPPAGEFSVTQGNSATVFGTRRVLERRQFEYRSEEGQTRYRLVTKVEVVLTNRGAFPVEAFVREAVESHGENRWTILESSHQTEALAANTFQMRASVPAGGKTVVTYTVESK
jgi:hypothetical protein